MKLQEAFEGLIEGKWEAVRFDYGVTHTVISYSEDMFDFYDETELEWNFKVRTYHITGVWEVVR